MANCSRCVPNRKITWWVDMSSIPKVSYLQQAYFILWICVYNTIDSITCRSSTAVISYLRSFGNKHWHPQNVSITWLDGNWFLPVPLYTTIHIAHNLSVCALSSPLTRYEKLRVAHAPGMPGTFSPTPTSNYTASKRSLHTSRHVPHARVVMHGGIANFW